MYNYSDFDKQFVRARIEEFRGQIARRLDGSLSEDEFKPLRLMKGFTCNCTLTCCALPSPMAR